MTTLPPTVSAVPSPCTNVCRMDAATGYCLGCRRTLDEIAAWASLDDAGKRAVWARLPLRQPSEGNAPDGPPATR